MTQVGMPPTNVDDTNEICLTGLTSACNIGTACFVDVVDTRTVYLASVVFTSEAEYTFRACPMPVCTFKGKI
jgi:hypothetical protein